MKKTINSISELTDIVMKERMVVFYGAGKLCELLVWEMILS